MKRRLRKSVWMPLVLWVYTTAIVVYFLPRNTEINDTEKWGTIVVSYLVIVLLWLVLRKREQMLEKRNREIEERYRK